MKQRKRMPRISFWYVRTNETTFLVTEFLRFLLRPRRPDERFESAIKVLPASERTTKKGALH